MAYVEVDAYRRIDDNNQCVTSNAVPCFHNFCYILFLHPRCVNSLAVLCLVSAEAVGEGKAYGTEAGVLAAHVLSCPVILRSDHHCLEDVVAVEGEDGVASEEGIAES